MQSYFFQIDEWVPSYSLSINQIRFVVGPYRERIDIEFKVTCIFPAYLAWRPAHFTIVGERNQLEPEPYRRDPDWKPRCVGLLEMPPGGGPFYASIPHESMSFVLEGLAHGLFRILSVYGPTLFGGKSYCTSINLMQPVNLEDY